MDSKTKEILDEVCKGNLNVDDAAKVLGITKEALWELIDDYDYVSTVEELKNVVDTQRKVITHFKATAPKPFKRRMTKIVLVTTPGKTYEPVRLRKENGIIFSGQYENGDLLYFGKRKITTRIKTESCAYLFKRKLEKEGL